jgi:hypothetical protein
MRDVGPVNVKAPSALKILRMMMMNIKAGDKLTFEVEQVARSSIADHVRVYLKGRKAQGDYFLVHSDMVVAHEKFYRPIVLGDNVKIVDSSDNRVFKVIGVDGGQLWLKQEGPNEYRFSARACSYEHVD